LACLLGAGTLLGLSTNLAKLAADAGLQPLPLLAWSVVGSALVLVAIGGLRGRLPSITARTLEYFLVAALVSVAAPNLLFFSAVSHVGAGFVALSIAFPPLLTYLGALVLRLERFDAARAAGVALALAGAAAIAIPKLNAPDAATPWIGATLLGPVFLAAGNLYRTLRWPPGARPDALAPGMLVASALLLLALGLTPRFSLAVPLDHTLPILLILAQVVTFSLQYLVFFLLQQRGGPVYLSLLGSVGAVVGVPVAILLLDEAPPQGLALGATLIAAGIALVTRAKAS
jgi:drug/metabolite transporter (DMT)-like permease